MKKAFILVLVLVGIIVAGFGYRKYVAVEPNEKVYVAIEGEGKIAVIDPVKKAVLRKIDLAREHDGERMIFMPHNVQVAPDQKTVWVTGNAMAHDMGAMEGMQHGSVIPAARAHGEEQSGMTDEVIVIDPATDRVLTRIPLAEGAHLAHVALTSDSAYAYITGQKNGMVYKINAVTFAVEQKLLVSQTGEPHGLRIASDDSVAYIAMLAGKGLGVLDLKSMAFTHIPLSGSAVQTGVTPDGKFVVTSLYDTKQLAVYRPATKEVSYIALPANSKGPIQMYPTPDSRFVYLADQGYYFNQPSGEMVYKIDLETMSVIKEIKGGSAPHGVLVSPDGKTVYITNLLSGDVSLIDTATDAEVGRIAVGKEPNGVSAWKNPQSR